MSFVARLRSLWSSACAPAWVALVLLLTSCASPRNQRFTFVQMCDPQLGFGGYDADLARFKQALRQINSLKPDFVVICGDLVNGANPKPCADFKAAIAELAMPCYCAPGNHDVGNKPTPKTLQHYRDWLGKDYYAFEHKGYEFVVLDSQLWKAPVPGETEAQDAWLRQTLDGAAKQHRPIFIIDHYPLFEHKPDEPEEYYNLPNPARADLLALFLKDGVVAVLSGHTHKTSNQEFQRIQMVNGEVTSRNFDKRPLGFRLWQVGASRPYSNAFVPLAGEPALHSEQP